MYKRRKIIKGECISGGVVLGRSRLIVPGHVTLSEKQIRPSRIPQELAALDRAINDTVQELQALRKSAGQKIGGPVARIFDAQLLIAQDQEFLRQVKEEIATSRHSAGYVYSTLVKRTTEPLSQSADEYMRQMVVDVQAVTQKVLANLTGEPETAAHSVFPPQTILVSKSFTPNDVMMYRQHRVVGFVICEGGNNSHMALIARSLFLPIVLVPEEELVSIPSDARIVINGSACEVVVNPTEADWTTFQKLKRRHGPAVSSRLRKLGQIPPLTKDGQPVTVAANLSLPGALDEMSAEKRIPVGLYRSEFL